jgi:hypothetical protein
VPPDQMPQTFSPSATIELPDVGIAQESSELRQFLGAASSLPENVEAATLIGHTVKDREKPTCIHQDCCRTGQRPL